MIPEYQVVITHEYLDRPDSQRVMEPFFPDLTAAFNSHAPKMEEGWYLDIDNPRLWELTGRDNNGRNIKMTFRMTDEKLTDKYNEPEPIPTGRKIAPPRFK